MTAVTNKPQPPTSEAEDNMSNNPTDESAASGNTIEPPEQPSQPSNTSEAPDEDGLGKKIKHFCLKAIDLTALGFLEPVVRLIYGEEPHVQTKKIIQFIVVPIIAVFLFLGLWSVVAGQIKTKSGQLPSPTVTYDAYDAIMTFGEREDFKEEAFLMSGAKREKAITSLTAQLAAAEAASAENKAALDKADADKYESQSNIRDMQAKLDADKKAQREIEKQAQAELKAQAETITVDDSAAKTALIASIAQLKADKDAAKEKFNLEQKNIDALLEAEFPEFIAARKAYNSSAEEVQYLKKTLDILKTRGRAAKLEAGEAKIAELETALAAAEGTAIYRAADRLASAQQRQIKNEEVTYAKPYTFTMQIYRSVLCVFVGFLMGSAIAIPFGICCGLSKTFMAALTPFIALFKPVSPIVWLPIALIVVGGLIKDPNNSDFLDFINGPFVSWIGINPAFLASAVTVALCSLWATMANTALGVASVDQDHINVARVLKLGFWQRMFKIILPSSLPLVFAGLRISLGVGWMVLIAAELLSSSEGIGKFVWDQFNNGASDSFAKMVVVVFVVGFIGLLLDRIMIIFQRMVSFEGSVASI